MLIFLFFAFISGLVTIFAPCIWPILPIILSSSTTGGKRKPLGITLGIMVSFGLLTLTISYIVSVLPFDPTILRYIAVVVIGFLGLTFVVPQIAQVVEGYVSRLSGQFGVSRNQDNGFNGGFLTGLSLGVVWTPCAGPILATIATLAATKSVNFQIILVTVAYIIGVGIPLFIFTTAGQAFFSKSRFVNKYTGRIQQIFGVIMILTALAILTNYDKVLQVKLLDAFPSYSSFITKLENNEGVQKQLSALQNRTENFGKAPEFTGITKWLNTEKPLTMSDLKGKVVLIDFWTYTCINCIRTLPYITKWYDTYKDEGFVVIGVHSPEFEFEKQTANVEQAIKQYNIHYPVPQDNDFATWRAYNNQYWPAHYLIDTKGVIRYTHFGEGKYEETEAMIQKLLKEAGKKVDGGMSEVTGDNPSLQSTPETYLGLSRMERVTNSIIFPGQQDLTIDRNLPVDAISFGGTWDIQNESSSSVSNSTLALHFTGSKVFLVIKPKSPQDKVKVLLDGKVIGVDQAGKDVKNGQIVLDKDRLYELVDLKGSAEDHILEIQFESVGTRIFAFTFG